MKLVLGLIIGVGLGLGALFLFDKAEPPATAVVAEPETGEVSAVVETEQADVVVEPTEPIGDAVAEPAETVVERVDEVTEDAAAAVGSVAETIENEMKDALSGADDTVDGVFQSLTERGGAIADGGSNAVKNALDNVLGDTSGIGSVVVPSTDIDAVANLELDAINGDARPEMNTALTVEGFDGLVIRQALVTSDVDDETTAKVIELVAVGEDNPDQLQEVVTEIRKLLGF
ncbi:hypothetical protein N9L47_05385 [Rhodobacteraceae bacterium]|nr:hypothetical protein [Paracoccaceae bacterium]